jgi:hypothetical protein
VEHCVREASVFRRPKGPDFSTAVQIMVSLQSRLAKHHSVEYL